MESDSKANAGKAVQTWRQATKQAPQQVFQIFCALGVTGEGLTKLRWREGFPEALI